MMYDINYLCKHLINTHLPCRHNNYAILLLPQEAAEVESVSVLVFPIHADLAEDGTEELEDRPQLGG